MRFLGALGLRRAPPRGWAGFGLDALQLRTLGHEVRLALLPHGRIGLFEQRLLLPLTPAAYLQALSSASSISELPVLYLLIDGIELAVVPHVVLLLLVVRNLDFRLVHLAFCAALVRAFSPRPRR